MATTNKDKDLSDSFGLTIEECVALSDEQGDPLNIKRFGGVEGVARLLRVDVKNGICGNKEIEIQARKAKFGENFIPDPPHKTYLSLLIDALKDTTMMILTAAAIVSLVLYFVQFDSPSPCSDFNPDNKFPNDTDNSHDSAEFIEAIAILIAVIVVSNVTATNDYSKEKQFQKLSQATRDTEVLQVTRNGQREDVASSQLVVGDVVHLSMGAKVPADGILIQGNHVSCDESALTGEPDAKKKKEGIYLKSGSLVVEGDGTMMVLAVGVNSDAGKSMLVLTSDEEQSTPLQGKLDTMAAFIGKLGLAAAVITVACALIRFAACRVDAEPEWKSSELRIILKYVILGITIVVVAVPEGLPLAVTISLAYSMRRMMKDQNLVRKLAACETMGGATNICSDKTGTLTENRMTVVKAVLFGQYLDSIPSRNVSISSKIFESVSSFAVLLQGLATNTSHSSFARLVLKPHETWESLGNKTECALLILCHELGGDFTILREQYPSLRTLPFNGDRKRMTSVIALDSHTVRVHTKGAAELVLGLCTRHVTAMGVQPLDDTARTILLDRIASMTCSGLRTICLAYKDISVPAGQDSLNFVSLLEEEKIENDLVLLGLVGIKDPVRPSVPSAVQSCKLAGITVRMVTGDNIETAKHIARECGILDPHGIAMEGSEFRTLSKERLHAILPRLQVLARSKPMDKFILVHALRELGEVVAVTGDGTNDAPALKEADVGLSMGTGTDVAKKASDIIILDDNFTSIVRAVMWGRNVYDSIRKFLQFQLTVNVSAICIAFIGAVANSRSPLTPVQLLWVNLIMDTFAALALATELPSPKLLQRPPHGRYDSLVSRRMWINVIGQSCLQIAVLCFMLFAGEYVYLSDIDSATHRRDINYTMIFNAFVMLQLTNEFNCRKLTTEFNIFEGVLSHSLFLIVMIGTLIVQVILVEAGGEAFSTVQLHAKHYFISLAFSTLSWPWGVLLKQIPENLLISVFARTPPPPPASTELEAVGV